MAVDKSLPAQPADPFDMKVRSSMTLFARASKDDIDFRAVLDKFYDGAEDAITLDRLGR